MKAPADSSLRSFPGESNITDKPFLAPNLMKSRWSKSHELHLLFFLLFLLWVVGGCWWWWWWLLLLLLLLFLLLGCWWWSLILNVVIFHLGDAAQSTCRDLWMEVMLKLVTVAIVQAWPQRVVCIQRVLGVSCRNVNSAVVQAVASSTATSVPWHQTVKRWY